MISAPADAAAYVSASVELRAVDGCLLDAQASAAPLNIPVWPVMLGPSCSQLACLRLPRVPPVRSVRSIYRYASF